MNGVGRFSRRSVLAGLLAAFGMAVFYALVVGFASGSARHLGEQASQDWYLLAVVIGGFAVQVACFVELRGRERLRATEAAAGGAAAGASTAGMIACCAHHLADLLPFLGATGLAAFLYDYRLAFVLVGVGVNTIGIILAVRRLRRTTPPSGVSHGPAARVRSRAPAESLVRPWPHRT